MKNIFKFFLAYILLTFCATLILVSIVSAMHYMAIFLGIVI